VTRKILSSPAAKTIFQMKSQLTLTFGETVSYSSETFIAHTGAREVADTLITLSSEKRFALVYIEGGASTGKTHLSVYCAGLLRSLEGAVDVVSGESVYEWYVDKIARGANLLKGQSLIVDDAENWLENPSSEGGFTAVADAILQANGLLVLIGSASANTLKVGSQIKSRLKAGVQMKLGAADEQALDLILKAMCIQRGLKLSEAKRRFVLSRVSRSIPALTAYVQRLQDLGRSERSSTSFELLTAALEGDGQD
jgi:chromosomal replication initiation ATPase DnaA